MSLSLAATPSPSDGSADFELAGCGLVIDAQGCLYWPGERLLVVSDLHLEKGSSFAARRGVFMPPYDSAATLARLGKCLEAWQPRTVISLGDSFHDREASTRLAEQDRQVIGQMMHGREWIWVSGNHDPEPPEALGGTCCETVAIGPLHFRHEPQPDCLPGEISGHLHPSAKIRRRGKSVRRRCLAGDGKRAILPAFGAFTGGLNVRDAAFRGLFDPSQLTAWMLGRDAVYPVNGRQLVA